MKRSEIAAAVIVAVLLVASGAVGIWAKNDLPPAEAVRGFDHSNCQYPDRWTNPPNGCDNSDPAVPECIKAFSTKQGEADCIAEYVKANQPLPVVENITPAQPSEAAEFGGK